MFKILVCFCFCQILFAQNIMLKSQFEAAGHTFENLHQNYHLAISINQENDGILLTGGFSFNLTDFNLEPPIMLFLTVRNQIDISYNILLKEVK
jgi:hypothetical protein